MNCSTCQHARRAGNETMIGCRYWTAIYRGDKKTMTEALKEIIRLGQLDMDLDKEYVTPECIGALIDTLIKEYAPKPIFEGWADLEKPDDVHNRSGNMTNFCVVLDPQRFCSFYSQQTEIMKT